MKENEYDLRRKNSKSTSFSIMKKREGGRRRKEKMSGTYSLTLVIIIIITIVRRFQGNEHLKWNDEVTPLSWLYYGAKSKNFFFPD